MEREAIISAMANQDILKSDLSQGPTAVIIQSGNRRPKCIIIKADGENFIAEVPGFFRKEKLRIPRTEVLAWQENYKRYQEFMAGEK